ncbi:MAG: DUF481 domain-containing protein [Reyranella sp.]|nr:DUF481 domain-containing protein [Reyranella sp.]
MFKWQLGACLCLIPLLANAVPAPPSPPPPPPPGSPWNGDLAVGFVKTTGSNNATTFNFKGSLDWARGQWNNRANAQSTYASSNGSSTANSYQFNDKLEYDLNPQSYVFGSFNYLNDHFAGIAEDVSESFGYGRHFIKTPRQELDGDLGLGASQQRDTGTSRFDNQLIGVLNLLYVWNITPQSHFKQTLHTEFGQQNTFVEPVSELRLDIWGNLFASIGYDLRYNTTVPAGTTHTNTLASVNFGYSFGKKP